MASGDKDKSKKQLLAEIDELRRQLAERDDSEHSESAASQPAFATPMTRRTALSTWVAPVILSIPFGAATRARTAHGQVPPTAPPTVMAPTMRPTLSAPTMAPTPMAPTMAPTLAPTMAPTLAPTSAPALPRVEAPALTAGGLAALSAGLAGAGAAAIRRAKRAPDANDKAVEPSKDRDEDETK